MLAGWAPGLAELRGCREGFLVADALCFERAGLVAVPHFK